MVEQKKMKIRSGAEVARVFFRLIGHKPLVQTFECKVGTVDLITKKDNVLFFIGVGREEAVLKATAEYYVRKYNVGLEYERKVISL